jgi:uncharacterized protein YpiB (UPF0302 family)
MCVEETHPSEEKLNLDGLGGAVKPFGFVFYNVLVESAEKVFHGKLVNAAQSKARIDVRPAKIEPDSVSAIGAAVTLVTETFYPGVEIGFG